jgi:hypothetical protein
LDANCFINALNIFAAGNILVWFCVSACTDLIQPIDAGIICSICISYVGHALNSWLSVSLSATEWRILMTNFLGEATTKILSDVKKDVRDGSFV